MPGNLSKDSLPHGLISLQPEPLPWLLWLGSALAALILLLVFVKIWKRLRVRKPAPAQRVEPVRRTGEELLIALKERLLRLEPGVPFGRQAQEEFFFELSLVFREVIELRSGIQAKR